MPVDKQLIKRLAALEKDKPIKLRINAVPKNFWFCMINGRNKAGPFLSRGSVYEFIERNPHLIEKRPVYTKFNIPYKFPCPYCTKIAKFDYIKVDDVFFNCGEHKIKWN